MTQLRWTTYDDRGPAWGKARVRVVALSVVFGLTALGGLTAASTSGRAEDLAAADATSSRTDDLATAQAEVRARRVSSEVGLHARFDGDRAAVNVFFQDLLTSLGTAEKIPASLLDAAKKSLEGRRT